MVSYNLKNIIIPTLYSNLMLLKSQKSYYLYVYNSNFFFLAKLKRTEFKIILDKNTTTVTLGPLGSFSKLAVAQKHNKSLFNVVGNTLNRWISSWDSYYFKKIKFKGKVYKITKLKNNNIRLSFGRCHRNIVAIRSVTTVKKKKIKNKVFMYSVNKYYLDTASTLITNVRPINLFTQRGLRLSKQIVYRKIGKKSSYTAK